MQNTSAEEYKLVSRFQSLRKRLLLDRYADRLERPLVFWTLHNDRRLPLAFLPRSLRSLLDTPFDELAGTAGVGQKKIGTLLELLAGAVRDPAPPDVDGVHGDHADRPAKGRHKSDGTKFDPSAISESMWERWRDAVCNHHMGYEKLGHLAPSLQSLATVMWRRPLSDYCDSTIAEMRQMKTHGEKRVRAILDVFRALYELLECLTVDSHLSARMLPNFVPPLEQWLADILASDEPPKLDETRDSLVQPLIEQLQVDCGQPIARLAAGRLGMGSVPQTVRQQSKRLRVTRARVYQMLEQCAKVMQVRWPEGGVLLGGLITVTAQRWPRADSLPLLRETHYLLFSEEHSLANRDEREETT